MIWTKSNWNNTDHEISYSSALNNRTSTKIISPIKGTRAYSFQGWNKWLAIEYCPTNLIAKRLRKAVMKDMKCWMTITIAQGKKNGANCLIMILLKPSLSASPIHTLKLVKIQNGNNPCRLPLSCSVLDILHASLQCKYGRRSFRYW